jgi:Lrp/AsnC family transcriptional regulator, leucine-responsive regulatory protein
LLILGENSFFNYGYNHYCQFLFIFVKHTEKITKLMKLDSTDKELLKLLQQDAHLTIKQLSSMLNLSPTPIYERIKRMEKDGIIKKYVAVIDREKIDRELMVFCNIRLKEHAQEMGKTFVDKVLSMTEVVECYNISGEYDFLLKVTVKDMKSYQAFLMNKLAALDNIGSTHSNFVMSEIKVDTVLEFGD